MIVSAPDEALESLRSAAPLTKEERRKKRQEAKARNKQSKPEGPDDQTLDNESRAANLLLKKEDELIKFVAKINEIYQDKLHKPAPFMTFVFCGMQSAGKSTIMERFLNAVLNIVQQGTGTRCPLDTTCIHDDSLTSPVCELRGEALPPGAAGDNLSVNDVFEKITAVNRRLAEEDRFSTEPLYLVYRAKNVQNMRFVDTPGIISTKSDTAKDNREDIKTILRSEVRKPNSKLCILLEPKELETNPIMNFCDETFGNRKDWIDKATFMMTKFDKQIGDCSSANKCNSFFQTFHDNKCRPFLVITETLRKENLPPKELYDARTRLLETTDAYERERFEQWQQELDIFASQSNDPEKLYPEIEKRIGFHMAKQEMRRIMLDDTAKRLPEVLRALREELAESSNQLEILKGKKKYEDPREVKTLVVRLLQQVEKRVKAYLAGDLEAGMKYPERLQTLDEEIENEEADDDWYNRELNHFSEGEEQWRTLISYMDCEYPDELQAGSKFLGGKQYQRAIEFFKTVLLEALPDPETLRDYVANATGHLSDGLHRENWEHAMVEVVRVSMKEVSHPGINYLIKHVGSIFRRLFTLALRDVKEGGQYSATFRFLPAKVETFLIQEFEDSLWDLMVDASEKTHTGLEPMYRTIDPNLPTFHEYTDSQKDKGTYIKNGTNYEAIDKSKKVQEEWSSWFYRRMTALASSSGKQAKNFLKEEKRKRAFAKKAFLPDERTSMITDEEIDTILRRSFEYIVGLMEFNLIVLKFQLNDFLFQGFKDNISDFAATLASNDDVDWNEIVQGDSELTEQVNELEDRVKSISESLRDVESLQRTV